MDSFANSGDHETIVRFLQEAAPSLKTIVDTLKVGGSSASVKSAVNAAVQSLEEAQQATEYWMREVDGSLDTIHEIHQGHHEDFLKAHEDHMRVVEELHKSIEEHFEAVSMFKMARFSADGLQRVSRLVVDGQGSTVPENDEGIAHLVLQEPRKKLEESQGAVTRGQAGIENAMKTVDEHQQSRDSEEDLSHLVHALDTAIHSAIIALSELLTPHGTVSALHEAVVEIHTALAKDDAFVTGFENGVDVHELDMVLVKTRG
ncbi:hypothetical protein BKA62DRAFT_723056 [Auriculariales sp. MPI-PUGE-AT-0066]|nr:hypothetical protein BKA62DRAFT_723056 [Auriculariales sp. MPI-PUGE-AT-0066]